MRTVIRASVTALGILAASSHAADGRAPEAHKRQWLSIQDAHAKVESAGDRNLQKIERSGRGYEVEGTDRNGRLESCDSRPGANPGRLSAECKDRRCRDAEMPRRRSSALLPTRPSSRQESPS